jgi:putative RNA 2'-phosphotransferase
MKPNYKKLSKFLSLVLRHKPGTIGLVLDNNGWANTCELLEDASKKGHEMSLESLKKIVRTNDKKRFAFNQDGTKIRASQGHSISIELGYEASLPPAVLFHGTATRFIDSIQKKGLEKRGRHHVHMSKDTATATNVGSRYGKVIILVVESKKMHQAGFDFFISENGVWLTNYVPPEYLIFP